MKEIFTNKHNPEHGKQYEVFDSEGKVRGFTYEFVGEGERENVLIHFTPDDALPALRRWKARITGSNDVSPMQKARIWKRGISALRASIGTHPLNHVKEVHALSWIVVQNPSFLEKEGFTVYDPKIHVDRRAIAEKGVARYREYVDRAGTGIRQEHRQLEPGYAWATKEDFLIVKKR